METHDDVVLLERAGRGDEAAAAELSLRHRQRAHAVAYRVLRDHELAEDAVQEAFLALWRTAPTYRRDRAPVVAWICVLAHRRACDIARKTARRAVLESESPPPEGSYTAEEVTVIRDEEARLRRAVASLGPEHREVVELAYWAGLSQSEVADRLDLPLGTVKSRTFAALRQLRDVLDEAA